MGDRSGLWNIIFWPTYNAADNQRTFSWILPHLVLPCTTFHYEKQTTAEPVSKFPASHGTQSFITVFTTICHKILFWARWNQYTSPNLISVTFLLILLSHLHHILLYGSLKLFYTVVIASMHATCPTHSILHDVINIIMNLVSAKWSFSFHLLFPFPNIRIFMSHPVFKCPQIHLTNNNRIINNPSYKQSNYICSLIQTGMSLKLPSKGTPSVILITQHCVPQNSILQNDCCKNLKFHNKFHLKVHLSLS